MIARPLPYDAARLDALIPVFGRPGKELSAVAPYRGLAGFVTADLYNGYQPPPYFVKGIVGPGELVVMFGESGSLKTFTAIDVCMHLATGRAYCGHRVRKTGVLFIAGEGGEGVKRRIMAWLIRHGVTAASVQPSIYVATKQADLMSDAGAIRATLDEAERAIGCSIGLVVFDTLAANFGAGDESRAEDMHRVMRTARESCGERAVVLVHHVGHGAKDRERGSYALRAAADCRIMVERPNDGILVSVSCLKAKDGEPFEKMTFEIRVVELGWQDADGDELTSLVLEPTDKRIQREPTTKTHKAIVDALRQRGASMARHELVVALAAHGIGKSSVYGQVKEMLAAGLLVEGFDKVSLPDPEARIFPGGPFHFSST